MILIDSGSTHSFVSPRILQNVGLESEFTTSMSITIANGEKMKCNAHIKGLIWKMCGREFKFDLKVMEIGVHELILGGDWMRSVGPVTLDFNELTVTVRKEGKRVKLQGVQNKIKINLVNGEEFDPEREKGELCWVTQLYPISEEPKTVILPKPLQKIN